jgi:hypothetical protein
MLSSASQFSVPVSDIVLYSLESLRYQYFKSHDLLLLLLQLSPLKFYLASKNDNEFSHTLICALLSRNLCLFVRNE